MKEILIMCKKCRYCKKTHSMCEEYKYCKKKYNNMWNIYCILVLKLSFPTLANIVQGKKIELEFRSWNIKITHSFIFDNIICDDYQV